MKIFIVEDDLFIADMLKAEFLKWNYDVFLAKNLYKLIEDFKSESPDIVLMDIKLPVYDGYHFTKEIRKFSNVPIIFISSKSDNMSQIMAIEMGADDFVTKPFDFSILNSKVKALLRRCYTYETDDTSLKKFHYDNLKHQFSYDEKTVELTKTENIILNLLIQNINDYVTRDELIKNCWESDDFIDDNTLFVNISRLRKKLSTIGLKHVIINKKNIGYKFDEENI